jgi:hypothetical protein
VSNNELFEKVVTTTLAATGGGGLMNPQQSNVFIDYMWDATVLANEGRTVRMRSEVVDIDKVNVGQKIVRLATEAVDDGVNADPTFSKVSLTTKKLRLDWELSRESLEDNIEEAALEDHIARLMATAFGNDVEDLAINGDTLNTGDALYKAFDGFKKLSLASGQVVDHAGGFIGKALFDTAIKAMPRKYLQRRNQLKFYTGSVLAQNYLYNLTATTNTVSPLDLSQRILGGDPAAPSGPAGQVVQGLGAFGIPIQEVPLFLENLTYGSPSTAGHGYVELTFPQNRIWGIKREIQVEREYKPKKDAIEYTVFARVGVQIENAEAYVVSKNVKTN